MNLTSVALLAAIMIYFVTVLINVNIWERKKRLNLIIDDNIGGQDGIRIFFFERTILDKLHINPEKIRSIIYVERTLLLLLLILMLLSIHGLSILVFGAIFIIIATEDAYRKVIYDSGITNINHIMNFTNFFVPHINGGNSADQSLLGYIEYSGDEELASFYEHRNDPNYKLQPHLQQIVDIYDIAKYNEEKGINDYAYILNELLKDYSQKQVYYNNFVSRIGEIKPIMLSYYFGVPILIIISFGQTYNFWMGIGGYIVAIITLILFGTFKFLIYKLQKDTVKTIF